MIPMLEMIEKLNVKLQNHERKDKISGNNLEHMHSDIVVVSLFPQSIVIIISKSSLMVFSFWVCLLSYEK